MPPTKASGNLKSLDWVVTVRPSVVPQEHNTCVSRPSWLVKSHSTNEGCNNAANVSDRVMVRDIHELRGVSNQGCPRRARGTWSIWSVPVFSWYTGLQLVPWGKPTHTCRCCCIFPSEYAASVTRGFIHLNSIQKTQSPSISIPDSTSIKPAKHKGNLSRYHLFLQILHAPLGRTPSVHL